MYQAFLERGHTVYTLSGYQGRGEGKLRAAEVEKAIAWVEENHPDLCYIESSTYPMIHNCDYKMIRYLHKKKIPTSYFYRDFYRKFSDLFPRRKGFANLLKETYLDIQQRRTDNILNLVDIVYFPSKQCFKYFGYKNMKALPPAGQASFLPFDENRKTCIYVGGVSAFYGFPLLMETFKILNSGSDTYRLILVCREAEYASVKPDVIPEWLEVHHASGKELESLYAKADIGLLTLTDNEYSDLAVGTKLFQYLSYGLPVLSTNAAAMTAIISENNFGEVAPYDARAFADAVLKMLSDDEQLRKYRQNVISNMTANNLWVHRVDRIAADLSHN